VDSIHYLYWLIFFPLVFYINTEKKLWTFIKSFLIGGTISLIITLGIFIKNYVNYKIGSDNEEVFKIERKWALRRLRKDMKFRLENNRRY